MFNVKAKQTKRGIRVRIKCTCGADVMPVSLGCEAQCGPHNETSPAERTKALHAALLTEFTRIGVGP